MKQVDKIALDRCAELVKLAKLMWKGDKELSRRYIHLARKLAMRHRLKLGRRSFCKKCNSVFIIGETLVVRTSAKEKSVIWKCKECQNALKFPFTKG